jgi:hypothetical protein
MTRRAGQPGTKKLQREYGSNLLCVRYRYDEDSRQRIKTVEIVVDRVKWQRSNACGDDSALVRFRIDGREDLLRRAVLLAGGRWEEDSDTWTLPRHSASALGLLSRLVESRKARKAAHDHR